MFAVSSIFHNFWLPNATTWFYFSLLLAVALFFKFSRLLSVRNWDIITVFLLVPGILILEDARPTPQQQTLAAAALVADVGSQAVGGPASLASQMAPLARANDAVPKPSLQWGYLWLLGGSAYLLVRCLFDLALVQRPALTPNLNFGGLAWLAGTLFICLTTVAFRPEERNNNGDPRRAQTTVEENDTNKIGRESAALELGQRSLEGWSRRAMAVLCHLIVVLGLIAIGKFHFQDTLAGMAAATFYLMLPYTGHYVPYLLHVWPMALILWAIVAYRMPVVSGLLLGLAAGTIYFPVLLFPLWLSFYWGRGAGRFTLAFVGAAALALAVTGLILLYSDDLGERIRVAVALSDWQPWKVPDADGFWKGVHWAYRIPVFIAFMAFVLTTAFWPSPKNLGHVIALSAAILIGVQFWYADRGGEYVLWYLPLVLLLIFRPKLADRRPVPIAAETDWAARTGRWLFRSALWFFKAPEPLMRVR